MFQSLFTLFKKQPPAGGAQQQSGGSSPNLDGTDFPTSPGHSHVAVAGLSEVGKTSLLTAFWHSLTPDSRWHEKGGLPWVYRTGGWKGWEQGVQPRTENGKNIGRTQSPYKIMRLETSLSWGRTQNLNVHFWDLAGNTFKDLANSGGLPKKTNAERAWQQADALLVMIAPENFADNQLAAIKTSLNKLHTLRQEAKSPSVHVVFTKADEYGVDLDFTGRICQKNEEKWQELIKKLEDEGIGAECRKIADQSPVVYYAIAAFPEDPAFGANSTGNDSAVTKSYDREGWDKRAVAPIFRDVFESCYRNRGTRGAGWCLWAASLVLGLLSILLLVDIKNDRDYYKGVWTHWLFTAGESELPTEREQRITKLTEALKKEGAAVIDLKGERKSFFKRKSGFAADEGPEAAERHPRPFLLGWISGRWPAEGHLVSDYRTAWEKAGKSLDELTQPHLKP